MRALLAAYAMDGARRALGSVPLLDAGFVDFSCVYCRRHAVCSQTTNGWCLAQLCLHSAVRAEEWRSRAREREERRRWAGYHRGLKLQQQARERRAVRHG